MPVIKAIRVFHDESSEQLRWAIDPYLDHVHAILLDTHSTSLWGGTGESFNWRLARELSADLAGEGVPLFLAGGLTPANVAGG